MPGLPGLGQLPGPPGRGTLNRPRRQPKGGRRTPARRPPGRVPAANVGMASPKGRVPPDFAGVAPCGKHWMAMPWPPPDQPERQRRHRDQPGPARPIWTASGVSAPARPPGSCEARQRGTLRRAGTDLIRRVKGIGPASARRLSAEGGHGRSGVGQISPCSLAHRRALRRHRPPAGQTRNVRQPVGRSHRRLACGKHLEHVARLPSAPARCVPASACTVPSARTTRLMPVAPGCRRPCRRPDGCGHWTGCWPSSAPGSAGGARRRRRRASGPRRRIRCAAV
jgi:hypothetical protein